MAENMEIISDDKVTGEEAGDNFFLTVLNHQIDSLYALQPLDFSALYDKADEDKIKCITACFETMRIAQRELRKKIKSF